MTSGSLFDIARPFILMAVVAFLVGFASYVATSRADFTVARPQPQPAAVAVSAPAAYDWNLSKRI